MLHLPDCRELEDIRIHIAPQLEQELVQKLAEQGEQAIRELVNEEMKKPSLIEKIKSLREHLERQSSTIRARTKLEQERLLSRLNREFQDDFRLLEKGRHSAEETFESYRAQSLLELEKALRDDALIKLVVAAPKEHEKPGFWQKLRQKLLSLVLSLLGVFPRFVSRFSRFVSWLLAKLGLGKKKKKTREDRILLFSNAAVSKVFADFGGQLDNALSTNESFRRSIKEEMKRKGRLSLRSRVDKERYREEAKRLVEERALEKVAKSENENKEKRQELKREISKVLHEEEKKKEELEEKISRLRQEYREEQERLQREIEEYPEKILKQRVIGDFKKLGYLRDDDGAITVTSTLIERFAAILLSHELEALPTGYQGRFGRSEKKEGIYEKEKMLSVDEVSRMDIMASFIGSRISHPKDKHIHDDDIIVNREHSELSTHVVIAVDTSYSMLEGSRMMAAKKAVLALYKAIKAENPRNTIDLVGFNTHVELMDLVSVWEAEPKGFTNTAGALKTASLLFKESGADSKLVYLITDGLPEAYINERGVDVVDDPDTCLPYAIQEAKTLPGKLILILLEPEDELYVTAAEKIVKGGRDSKMLVTDPQKLAREMLEDFILA